MEWVSKDIPNTKTHHHGGYRLLNVRSGNDIDLYFIRYDAAERGALECFHSGDGLNYELKEIIADHSTEVQIISPVVKMNSECDWDAPIIIVSGCGIGVGNTYVAAFGQDYPAETKLINWEGDTAQLDENYILNGRDCLRLRDEDDTKTMKIIMDASFPGEFILEYELASDTVAYDGCGGAISRDERRCCVTFRGSSNMGYYYTDSDYVSFSHMNEINRWYSISIIVKGLTGNVVDVYVDGTGYLFNQPLNERPLGILVNSVGSGATGNTFVRNIRIRKYAYPEPSVIIGAEEVV